MSTTDVKPATGHLAGLSGARDALWERGLREKAYFENLVENAMEGIVIADKDGHILRANPEFQRIFGYSISELAGRSLDDLIVPPQRRNEAVSLTQRVLQGEKVTIETVRRRRDGGEIPVSIIASSIFLEKSLEAVFGIYRDISDQRSILEELIRSEKRFQDIALSSADWIWEVDKNGLYTFASGKVKQILGYESEEIIGKSPFDLMPRHEAARLRQLYGQLMADKQPLVDLVSWKIGRASCRERV